MQMGGGNDPVDVVLVDLLKVCAKPLFWAFL